jgi:hypothetical protein
MKNIQLLSLYKKSMYTLHMIKKMDLMNLEEETEIQEVNYYPNLTFAHVPEEHHGVMNFLKPPSDLDVPLMMEKMYNYFINAIQTKNIVTSRREPATLRELRNPYLDFDEENSSEERPSNTTSYVSFEEFCSTVNITVEELHMIADRVPKLKRMIKFCDQIIRHTLVKGGLDRTFDAKFARFVAVNDTDMEEKSSESSENMLSDILKAIDDSNKAKTPRLTSVSDGVNPHPLGQIDESELLIDDED